ncbi:hypothetical protein Pint_05190 [Pistacia integerrima]|uniref:Uncharacterized protein n=1 Tax=Pistacia integerrima TaxID=434235 RepID=A0ACC0Z6D3_9ROSI|nr:hypothetical protein Pint_05190 [Pistacia integerrima]
MVSQFIMFSSASPLSFLSQTIVSPTKIYSLNPHKCLSLTKTPRTVIEPTLSFRPTNTIYCNCLTSPINLLSEIETVTFFQEFGFSEKETELLFKQNPTLRLTSFDNIRDRMLSMQSVGLKRIALFRVISKSPNVLIAEEIDTLICFLRDDLGGKIEPLQIERLFVGAETRFLVGFDQKVRLLGIPQEQIVHVLNNVNLTKALCLKSIEEIERTIAFLNPFGGSDLIVKRPKLLNYDLDTQLLPRINFINKLSRGDVDATGTVLQKFPTILSYSVKHVENHVKLLRSFGGLNDEEIFKIILVFPGMISASRERKLHPRIEFLKQCGLDSSDLFKFLTKAPLFLALSCDNLAHKLAFLVKIGYKYRTKELTAAMGAVTRTSCENMQKVIGVFLCYGLSFADILAMSKKHPQILQYSHSSLEEKMEYLIEEMGREVGELLAFPAFLGYKLDERIKHRYEVKRKTLGEGMSINKLLSVSAERFKTKERKT